MNNPVYTRDRVSLLLSDAKRRPDIKALVDRIGEMTCDDIDNAVVPLAWYRDALKELKERQRVVEMLPALEQYADAMGEVTILPLATGETYRALEDITLDNSGLSLPIKNGDLLFRDLSGIWWLGSFPIQTPDRLAKLLMDSLGTMTRHEFSNMVLTQT